MKSPKVKVCALVIGVWLQCAQLARAQPHAAPDAGPAVVKAKGYLRVEIDNDAPLKVGALVQAHTIEPLYAGETAVIPLNSKVDGSIVKLEPVPKSAQINAYSHGDFTPLRRPTVHFQKVITPDGYVIVLDSSNAEFATTTIRLESSTVRHSLIARLWANGKDRAKLFVRNFTAPGRASRARQFLYLQLPYHPQLLLSHTQYDIPLRTIPVAVKPAETAQESSLFANVRPPAHPSASTADAPGTPAGLPTGTFTLHSRLVSDLNSKDAKQGDEVIAEVTQPLIDPAGRVTVPVGSLIRGSVLRVQSARKMGRSGALRFTFSELVLPSGDREHVTGVPTAIYAQPGYPQRLDNEGGVQSRPKRSVLFPLVLGAVANRSLQADENQRAHAAVSSNGFGLITRIITTASGSNVAGGVIGGITSARAFYSRFIGRGQEVEFPAHTPIEIELNKAEAPVLRGNADVPRGVR